jgi:antitoxin (DNA-binding transcriptional repressor) of toxin-antitoxin stability system
MTMFKKKKISVSELKVHALQIIETVKTTKQEVEIYKRGKLVAKISPLSDDDGKNWIGCLDGRVADPKNPDSIIEPINANWDAEKSGADQS